VLLTSAIAENELCPRKISGTVKHFSVLCCGKNDGELNKTNAIPLPVVQGEGYQQESIIMLWFVLVSASYVLFPSLNKLNFLTRKPLIQCPETPYLKTELSGLWQHFSQN